VAGEFGLVAVDRSAIEAAAESGSARAKSTLAALRTLSFQLSGAQLGITITSLVVGFLTEPAIAPAIQPLVEAAGLPEGTALGVSITVALILATTFEMVLAELFPKNLAIARPLGMALSTAPALRFVNRLFRPVIVFLNESANWTVRLLGIEPQEELMPVRSLQELDLLIHSSRAAGSLMEEEFNLLSRSITFGSKTASDALVPRTSIVAVQAQETVAELSRKALEHGHSRFPVYGENLDDIIGVAHVKDVYQLEDDARESTPVATIARVALVVPETRDLESLLIDMRRERKQLVVVVDEFGGTAGIVTIEDLMEEIVGEIEDEYDLIESPQLTSGVPEGVHVLSALLHPDEVKEACGFNIPEGPYDTLAGFLFFLFGRIPERGAHVSYQQWEFKVIEMDGKRIDKVLVVMPPTDENDT
jgi:CBS domain containing-hemolysin-like protein